MALNTSFFYFIILWKGHADVMVDGPLGLEGLRPFGRGNASPLWCLTAPPSPRSSVGRQKESALMGRLGALLRPTWRSYAGPPQWHYNPCLL